MRTDTFAKWPGKGRVTLSCLEGSSLNWASTQSEMTTLLKAICTSCIKCLSYIRQQAETHPAYRGGWRSADRPESLVIREMMGCVDLAIVLP